MVIFLIFLVSSLRDTQLENMEFTRVHNEWVGEFAPFRIDYCLPPEFSGLQVPCYQLRQQARQAIERQGLGALDVLALASRHRDPNINIVAKALLDGLYACYECRGAQMCIYCNTEAEYEICKRCNVKRECRLCNGTGDRRYVVTGDTWEYRKNIFPGR